MDKIEIGYKITDLTYNLTGECIQTANRIAVTKEQVCKAAAMLGFAYDGNFTIEAYAEAYQFLSDYLTTNKYGILYAKW